MKTIWVKIPSWLKRRKEIQQYLQRAKCYEDFLDTMPKEYKPDIDFDEKLAKRREKGLPVDKA